MPYGKFISAICDSIVYYVQDWDRQNPTQIVTELCGFVTILSGTFLLHKTKDMTDSTPQSVILHIFIDTTMSSCLMRFFQIGTGPSLPTSRSKSASQNRFSIEVVPLKYRDSVDEETLPLSLPKADNRYLMEDFPVRYKDLNIA